MNLKDHGWLAGLFFGFVSSFVGFLVAGFFMIFAVFVLAVLQILRESLGFDFSFLGVFSLSFVPVFVYIGFAPLLVLAVSKDWDKKNRLKAVSIALLVQALFAFVLFAVLPSTFF
ncbi:hypothetical protein K8R43_00690 [archaeon]|nr:hypothetical protein [archaeon]